MANDIVRAFPPRLNHGERITALEAHEQARDATLAEIKQLLNDEIKPALASIGKTVNFLKSLRSIFVTVGSILGIAAAVTTAAVNLAKFFGY